MCGHITRTWEIEIKDRWSQNVKKAFPLEKDYRTKVLFSSVASGKTTTATTKNKNKKNDLYRKKWPDLKILVQLHSVP